MPSAELLIPFFIASAVFACVPGPGMFYAAAQTLASGRRAGWRSAFGFHVAGLGQVAATAFGMSALIAMVPALFLAMKLAGAAYLILLGVGFLRRARRPAGEPRPAPVARKTLRDAVLVGAVNPKSALFFLAFLPQFTDPAAALPLWAQIVVLGAIVNAMFSVTDVALIEASHALARRLSTSARFTGALRKLGGGVLVALGIDLALTRNP